MHTIQTFILRLLVDTDEPQALRGTVRSVTDDEKHSFTDGSSLLALLHRLCHPTDKGGIEQLPQTQLKEQQNSGRGG